VIPVCDFRTTRHPAKFVCFRDSTVMTPPLMIVFSSWLQVRRWIEDDAAYGTGADCTIHDSMGNIVAYMKDGQVIIDA